MSFSIKLIEPKESLIYSQLVRSTGDNLGLPLVSEVRGLRDRKSTRLNSSH